MSAANDKNSKTTPVNNTKKTKRNVRARKGQSNSDDDSSASLDEGYIISNIIKLTE